MYARSLQTQKHAKIIERCRKFGHFYTQRELMVSWFQINFGYYGVVFSYSVYFILSISIYS